MKILLILSFYFPPHYGVKVVRTAKFCKLLPFQGWKPWVLTVDPRYYGGNTIDHYAEDLKNTTIFRIPYVPFPGNLTIIKLLYSLIAAGFAFFNRSRIDAVYMSGSPFYPFPLTVLLTGLLKIPSVLDFRDSFSFNFLYDEKGGKGAFSAMRTFVYGTAEKIAVRSASWVVFATSALQEEYRSFIPKHSHKYSTIHNGIDLDDLSNIEPLRVSKRKTIIMAGQFNVYSSKAMAKFFKCLKTMPDIHFLYAGEENTTVARSAEKADIMNQVTVLPFQPYHEVLRMIAGSDAALLANGPVNGMGTKIFDYLALNKPVLCLVPKDSIITRQFGHYESVVISEVPHTCDTIRKGLEKVFSVKGFDPVPLDSFTRQEATLQLASILRRISRSNAG